MTVKVILLKSGEDVISDAKEILNKSEDGIIAYHLSNPYAMQLTTTESDEIVVEGEAPKTKFQVAYSHWAPLSKQREFIIPADWVVTIYDPHDNILKDYCAKHEIKTEEESNGDQTDPAS
jgi:hypothetical protein|tara:strand:- start:159 stop:518 length:360 start_codon:yes stop_codon:yes gene_type:complete